MTKLAITGVACAVVTAAILGCATHTGTRGDSAASPRPADAAKFAVIPSGKDSDLKLYYAGGRIASGSAALASMQKDAELILWLAGNQFFAMDEVVRSFQQRHPDADVGLITLPPGLIMNAILAGGWTYEGRPYPGLPDVYASVNLGHLRNLKKSGLMDRYAVYMHNELEIMVARGNPKRISGIKDLVREGVRTSMPNPVNEGIMQFYARKVLERHGIWQQISAGKECYSCQSTPQNWFTAVHHRETPERIKAGTADAGIVWKTETQEAVRSGAPVEAVTLPPQDSLRHEVAYVIGALKNSPRAAMAGRYLEFLRTEQGQAAYANYGFVRASQVELALKPIPD